MNVQPSIRLLQTVIIPLCLLIAPLGTGAETMTITLEEAIRLGLVNSTSVQSKLLAVQKARVDLEAARSGYFPSLSAGLNWAHDFEEPEPATGFDWATMSTYDLYTRPRDPVTGSLELGQALYTFGKLKGAVHSAREALSLAEVGLEEEKRSLSTQIRRAFYQYLLSKEVVNINEQTLDSKRDALEVARKKYEAGISSDFEVLQAEEDVESFIPEVISAQNQVKLTLLTVKDLLGIEDEEEVEVELVGSLEMEPLDLGKEELIELAMEKRYDIRSLRINRRLSEVQRQLNKTSRLPTISGFMSYRVESGVDASTGKNKYWGDDAWDGSLTGGINVEIPISSFFPWSRERAELNKSRLELEDLKLGYDSLQSRLKLEVESILLRLEEARLKITSAQKGLELAERLLQSATEQYARGLISNIDLEDAQLSLNGARLSYIQNIYNHEDAMIDLMNTVGIEHF